MVITRWLLGFNSKFAEHNNSMLDKLENRPIIVHELLQASLGLESDMHYIKIVAVRYIILVNWPAAWSLKA